MVTQTLAGLRSWRALISEKARRSAQEPISTTSLSAGTTNFAGSVFKRDACFQDAKFEGLAVFIEASLMDRSGLEGLSSAVERICWSLVR